MSDIFSLKIFERHPYATGTTVIVGGVALWWFFLRGADSTGTQVVQVQPGQSEADYQQAQQIAGQLAMAQLSAQTQIAVQTQQLGVKSQEDAYNFQLAQLQLGNEADATDKQFELQKDALQTQASMQSAALANQLAEQQAGYAAQLSGMKIAANSAIAQTTISANLQQNLAAINAQLQSHAIDAQSNNFQAQLNTQAIVNGQNVSAMKHSSDDSMWGGIAIAAIAAFA